MPLGRTEGAAVNRATVGTLASLWATNRVVASSVRPRGQQDVTDKTEHGRFDARLVTLAGKKMTWLADSLLRFILNSCKDIRLDTDVKWFSSKCGHLLIEAVNHPHHATNNFLNIEHSTVAIESQYHYHPHP